MGHCCARFAVPLLNSLQKTVVVAHIGFPPSLALTTFEQELEVSLAASTPSLPPFALVGHSQHLDLCNHPSFSSLAARAGAYYGSSPPEDGRTAKFTPGEK